VKQLQKSERSKPTPRTLRKLDYRKLKEADYQKLKEADHRKRNPLNGGWSDSHNAKGTHHVFGLVYQ
jgi:hypothetical protein